MNTSSVLAQSVFDSDVLKNRSWSSTTNLQSPARAGSQRLADTTLDTVRHLQDLLLHTANLDELMQMNRDEQRQQIEELLAKLIEQEQLNLAPSEYTRVVTFILNEALGYGPLSPLMADSSITEVMVNGVNSIFIERAGLLIQVKDVAFLDEKHLRSLIDRIVARVGRRIDEASPRVDARLDDGSRVNILIPPLALDGPTITIRKFRKEVPSLDDLVALSSLSFEMAEFLKVVVKARLSILVSGGTGSGKTTLVNALAAYIGENERVITVEDSAELKLHQQHPHVVRTETRPANVQGTGEVTIRELVRNALRMRPDRIIVGEVRSGEALDMLQAMNTGHEGSMTTLHANSTVDALRRLETMVMYAEGAAGLPIEAIRQQITSAIDIIVQVSRYGAERKISVISEVLEMRHGEIVVRDLFRFDKLSEDPASGKVIGRFDATGVLPHQLVHLERRGAKHLRALFQSRALEEELGSYLRDDKISEVMINGARQSYIERRGEGLKPASLEFQSDAHLMSLIKSIIAPLGRLLDERHPMVDARLPDGSRINAVIPPVAQFGPTLTIRRFPKQPLTVEELVESGAMSQAMVEFLAACVKARLNLLVSGGTGTGKTTLLNTLTSFIGNRERLITIEDVAELRLEQDHWVCLEARPVDDFGEGKVTIRDLVSNALRMRPDRIIVGEVRGAEALDMLQAMNTGHEGSMTTIHANSSGDAFLRLETLVMWAGTQLPIDAVRSQITRALDIIVQVERTAEGKRRVSSIAEVVKETERPQVREIFAFRQGNSAGQPTFAQGHICVEPNPACLQRILAQGVKIELF